jgi:hypothetical protein
MPAPRHRRAARLLAAYAVPVGLTLALIAAATSCEDGRSPTGTRQTDGGAAALAAQSDVTIQGTIPLPINQSGSTASPNPLFSITQTGTGPNGKFLISNTSNTQDALFAQTNTRTSGYAFHARSTAMSFGSAGFFENANPSNGSNTLYVFDAGPGNAVSAVNTGNGWASIFSNTSATNSKDAVFAQNAGSGNALHGVANGSGWAGFFEGNGASGRGVLVVTQGGTGLQVLGGTKSAVVPTAAGARALYTEESTEVWFTDYGFGKLQNGRARILLDPTFAQTVEVDEPYHVFLEEYGDADMYVRDRTPLGFEVVYRGGNDRNAEFSYRVVAKRKGFEARRLERAPWADDSPTLARR